MKKIYLGIFLAMILVVTSVMAQGTITRTVPSTASSSSTFIVTYTASYPTSPWGVSIQESVSGGCKFSDGTSSYKSVMLSTDGSTKSILITSPSTSSSCAFTGDYEFGSDTVTSFPSSTITISGSNPNPTPTPTPNPGTDYTWWIAGGVVGLVVVIILFKKK